MTVGGYGIYAMTQAERNAAGPVESDAAPAGAPAVPGAKVTRELSAGAMTAFVVKPGRPPVADIAFTDRDGKTLKLSQWRGRVVLLNLWATWCVPCREEMPALAALQQRFGSDRFEVVAVSLDRKGAEVAAPFLEKVKADALALYLDPKTESLSELRAVGLPTTILVDAQGREIGRLAGPAEWSGPDAVRLIEAALSEGGEG